MIVEVIKVVGKLDILFSPIYIKLKPEYKTSGTFYRKRMTYISKIKLYIITKIRNDIVNVTDTIHI